MQPLNISTLRTSEDIDSVVWEAYTDDAHSSWVRNITSYEGEEVVSSKDLNRLEALSQRCNTVRLSWSMGELYFTRHFQLQLSIEGDHHDRPEHPRY